MGGGGGAARSGSGDGGPENSVKKGRDWRNREIELEQAVESHGKECAGCAKDERGLFAMLLAAPGAKKQHIERDEENDAENLTDQSAGNQKLKRVRVRLLDQAREIARLNPPAGFAECS